MKILGGIGVSIFVMFLYQESTIIIARLLESTRKKKIEADLKRLIAEQHKPYNYKGSKVLKRILNGQVNKWVNVNA